MSTPDLSVEHLRKDFADHRAVDDLSFSVERGSFFSILGPSGCGKTTLLRMIAGFIAPDGGAIQIGGKSMQDIAPNRRPVNMVFQQLALFPMMSVGENVAFGLARRGMGKDQVKEVSDADLNRFPVEQVSWDDVQEFLKKLNEREKGKGWTYRLPKEAEWEYACRGAATSKEECSFDFYFAKGTNDLSGNQANFHAEFPAGNGKKGEFLNRPTMVGQYPPNKLGLYDMHGNVWQWCEDLYPDKGSVRVFRGGSWRIVGQFCRAAAHGGGATSSRSNALGVRLARVLAGK